jgi:hypothetical protein
VTFAIRPYFGTDFIAASFFPDDPGSRRWVDINVVGNQSFFQVPAAGYDQVGVLRHEFGHILGFRHEHIRLEAPISCHGDESMAGAEPLTQYDPHSVMHYFCGGAGTKKLQFTDLDKRAASVIYPPAVTNQDFFLTK